MQGLAVGLVYVGLLAACLGGLSVLRPLSLLRITTRLRGFVVLLVGGVLVAVGASLPAPEVRVLHPTTHLDSLMPVYQFHDVHRALVAAPRESVYLAIQRVKASEVHLFKEAIWVRRAARRGTATTLAALPHMALLELLSRVGFMTMADDPGQEIVIGAPIRAARGARPAESVTPETFQTFEESGHVMAAMSFLLEDRPGGRCVLTTETRVRATDPATRRTLTWCWRLLYPGSVVIRRSWVGAIARRATES